MKSPKLIVLCLCLGASTWTALSGSDSSSITTPLQPTPADPDAKGTLLVTLSPKRSTLRLSAANLEPSAAYTLLANGQAKAGLTSDARGRLRLTLSNPAKAGAAELQFDPRGQTLEIQRSGTTVLQTVVSGSGEPVGTRVTEKALLESQVVAAKPGSTMYSLSKKGDRKFTLTVPAAPGTTSYEVYIDGVLQGNIPVKGRTARAQFTSTPKKSTDLLLDFDPRGKVIDLVQSDQVTYSGECEARGWGVNHALPEVVTGVIPRTSLAGSGEAKARYRVHGDARETFSVEVEDVAEGAYDLIVNGTVKGTINVLARDEGGTEGEIEFSTQSDDPDKLPLDFDPLTAVYQVLLGADIYFEGALDTTGTSEPGSGETHIEEYLTSTGLQPAATGKAEFESSNSETEFKVKLENAAVGRYDVWVGSTHRGHITVLQGEDRAETKWSSERDSRTLLLNFEPRGELIEITSTDGTLFSHVFGTGNGVDGETPVVPFKTELPLFSSPGVSGTAKFEYEQEDDGESDFGIEIEDAPAGVYQVIVAGIPRGTITVSELEDGTYGKIEFENDDHLDPGEVELDFNPLGLLVELQKDGAVYFAREVPGIN